MNSGQISDRVYGALRSRLVERIYLPGQRLDPALLAEDLASSVTPVRDALHRLTGESLVVARTSEGFFVPALDQIALADLRAWSADIIKASIAVWPQGFTIAASDPWPTGPLAHAQATVALFGHIAAGSPNTEHRRASSQTEARLAPTYQAECGLLSDLTAEMLAIAAAASEGDRAHLRRLIDAHGRRRLRIGAELVRALYRPG